MPCECPIMFKGLFYLSESGFLLRQESTNSENPDPDKM